MRIFVDCSYIDFTRQPTGIPRVVLKYIECGYRWSERTGIEVVPVVTTPSGLQLVRPVPGRSAPRYLEKYDPLLVDGPGRNIFSSTDAMLELAAFHLQSALVEAGRQPSADRCISSIRHSFDNIAADSGSSAIKLCEGDVLFCPAYWHDVVPQNFRAIQRQGCKVITLVHDILPVTFPRFYKAPWKYEFESNVLQHLRHSDAIYAVSGYTADALLELSARKGIVGVQVNIAYNGYDRLIDESMQRKIETGSYTPHGYKEEVFNLIRNCKPYLMIGTIEPKKGHIPTIRSFETFWDAGLSRPLVIIGRKGWLEESVVSTIEKSKYYNNKLYWFDDFDDLDLSYAYYHSRGLIFSSYAEGFGIPMIESLSARRPVVAYETPINREILGEYGLMFRDFSELAKHIVRLESDDAFGKECERVTAFSWPSWQQIVSTLFDELSGLTLARQQ